VREVVADGGGFAFDERLRPFINAAMEFVNLTRRTEIGANSYLLRIAGRSIVLDCGMHPKERGLSAAPDYAKIEPGSVNAIVITHAHQDHIGSLPLLTRNEQQALVFMTEPTRRIGEIMLHNSVNVMLRQREDEGMMEYPLFTHRSIELSRSMWRPAPARTTFTLDGERGTGDGGEPTLEFWHAGHILGSAGVLIRGEGRTVFYTGDVNFEPQTLMKPADFPTEGVDVLIMETTRGDAPTREGFTREAEERRFAEAILAAFERGGSVTIPVFALGKTQEILTMLWNMRRRGELAQTPVYIGGLSTKITTAYDSLSHSADRGRPELALLQEMAPYVLSGNEVHTFPARSRCIFALSSGMMTERTLSNYWVRKILPDPKQTLFFVGYSDPESPAGRVRAAKPGDRVVLDPELPPVELRCAVESFAFSAHSAREGLLNYALALKPRKILLVHGDPPAVAWFRNELAAKLPGTEVVVPPPGAPITL
jgi:Cft2 family RNA processing exonuclease